MASSSSMDDPVVDQEYRVQIDRASDLLHRFMSPGPLKLEINPQDWLRLAWNDAGTYNVQTNTGGANGLIRHCEVLKTQENSYLGRALQAIEIVKEKYPKLTYADIIQLAGIVAVKVSGGPDIEFVPGRKDSLPSPDKVEFPDAIPGSGDRLITFSRMGLSDGKDIVALSGGLKLARAFQGSLQQEAQSLPPMKFDNSYFVELLGTLADPADLDLLKNPNFCSYIEEYRKDKNAFFRDYAAAHKKFSELGYKLSSSDPNVMGECSTSSAQRVSSGDNVEEESSTSSAQRVSSGDNVEEESSTALELTISSDHNVEGESSTVSIPGVIGFVTCATVVVVLCYLLSGQKHQGNV